MLLGLVAAAVLATLLQLLALRAKRAGAFECAADGVINLRCWVVVEAPATIAARPAPALPAPGPRPEAMRFAGEMRMLRPRRSRRPVVQTPAMVHASVKELRARDVIVIPAGLLEDVLGSAAAWSPPSQAPPPFRNVPMASVALH